MTNMIVAGLVVAMIVSPTLCYPSHQLEVENEWFQTESPVIEGAENEWFQPPTPVEGIYIHNILTSKCIIIVNIDEDVFEMEDAEIEGINFNANYMKCFLCVACSGTEYCCLCPCWNA